MQLPGGTGGHGRPAPAATTTATAGGQHLSGPDVKCPVAVNDRLLPTSTLAVVGDTAIDSRVLFTVTLKFLKALLPALSVIVNASLVLPCGKVEPLGSPCVRTMVSIPLSPSDAARSNATTAPAVDVALAVMLPKLAADGWVLSNLITNDLSASTFPRLSVAW